MWFHAACLRLSHVLLVVLREYLKYHIMYLKTLQSRKLINFTSCTFIKTITSHAFFIQYNRHDHWRRQCCVSRFAVCVVQDKTDAPQLEALLDQRGPGGWHRPLPSLHDRLGIWQHHLRLLPRPMRLRVTPRRNGGPFSHIWNCRFVTPTSRYLCIFHNKGGYI